MQDYCVPAPVRSAHGKAAWGTRAPHQRLQLRPLQPPSSQQLGVPELALAPIPKRNCTNTPYSPTFFRLHRILPMIPFSHFGGKSLNDPALFDRTDDHLYITISKVNVRNLLDIKLHSSSFLVSHRV
jgi:hypothetical protein